MPKHCDIKILVLSEGPPPVGDTPVEGGGLRAWGLAKSLSDKGIQTTYAYRASFPKVPQSSLKDTDPKVTQWHPDHIKELTEQFTHVILRYSMGEMKLFMNALRDNQILIADCYIPISVEFSAREVANTSLETKNYQNESYWWEQCAKRADYFLYASDQQLSYYLGYLSGILKLNPTTYKSLKARLIKLPYGYFQKDIAKEVNQPENPSLVWYGAIYPWFNMKPVVEAAKLLKKEYPNFKMIIAGAKNPYTSNKDFLSHYAGSMELIKEIEHFTEIIGHTPYSERFNIYAKGSTIITINKDGLENNLAWRTRLADYIAARKPIITNGGDPLGEKAIEAGIAERIADISSSESIQHAFKKSLKINISDKNQLVGELTWENNIHKLINILSESTRLSPETINISATKPKLRLTPSKLSEIKSYSKLVIKEQGIATLFKKALLKPFKLAFKKLS